MGKVITFGEIMMRLNPPGYLRYLQTETFDATYGGGEANVAVSLVNYGNEAAFVSKVRITKSDKTRSTRCAGMALIQA